MSNAKSLIFGIICVIIGFIVLFVGWRLLQYFEKMTTESSWAVFGVSVIFWIFGIVAIVSSK